MRVLRTEEQIAAAVEGNRLRQIARQHLGDPELWNNSSNRFDELLSLRWRCLEAQGQGL